MLKIGQQKSWSYRFSTLKNRYANAGPTLNQPSIDRMTSRFLASMGASPKGDTKIIKG